MSNVFTHKTQAMADSVRESAIVQQIAWNMFVDTINELQKQYKL